MPHTSETHFRVRYAETDQMGVVYYANYLVWMEVGRTDFCKTLGFNYKDMEREGAFLVVTEANCRYLAPAHYDDAILVETRLDNLNRRFVTFGYSIRNEQTGRLLAEGNTAHVAIGLDQKPKTMPQPYLDLLKRAATADNQ
jgi:acyl-CoA thioester hydrolase